MFNEQNLTISVIGLGYIGLPTASLLATKGFKVNGTDVNQYAVDTINQGNIHIEEADLDILVRSAVNSGQLKASTDVKPADIFIIAVPTPFDDHHQPDLSYVKQATDALAPHLQPNNLVILESTSPVGTTEKIATWITESRPELSINGEVNTIYVAHCPERVLPGQILKELIENDRIIGGINLASTRHAAAFYQQFVQGKIITTNARTAELSKLVENSFRDVNIAFANELSIICEKLDIDVWDLIELANHHPRVNILQPGPGVGGHCIAVDPWFIIAAAPEQSRLIKMARDINDDKKSFVVDKVLEQANRFKAPSIACLGLSYKADIDDLRESPAVDIVQQLLARTSHTVLIVEPHVETLPEKLSAPTSELCHLSQALALADIIVLLVDHTEFKQVDRLLLHEKVIIDTKGVWR